jgi:hypothetical protein
MHTRLFLLVSFSLVLILPVLNIVNSGYPEVKGLKNKAKELFTTDVIEGTYNHFLFKVGISSNPSQVIVGSNDWLFLGDKYAKTISEFRKGSDTKIDVSQKIIDAQLAWKKYFSNRGVEDFRIIVGPNKSTVYSNKVPSWAKSEGHSISKNLYNNDVYINSIEELVDSKSVEQTYYNSDTHWNSFGAGVAFVELMKTISSQEDFVTPNKNWNNIVKIKKRGGGDLAAFLKIKKLISESEPITEVMTHVHQHFIYDYDTKKLAYQGNKSLYGKMQDAYIIHTPTALNESKVLWLSDSFGGNMAPYMTSTFSHILKQHWNKVVGTPRLQKLLEEWKPDYVIYTVVERGSLSRPFLNFPPIQLEAGVKLKNIGNIKKPRLSKGIKLTGNSQYTVSGLDPFLVFNFGKGIPLKRFEQYRLNFDIECKSSPLNIPIQVFWRTEGGKFSETQSIRFGARNGNNQVVLYGLNSIRDIASFRIDLDKTVHCKEFTMNSLELGIPSGD